MQIFFHPDIESNKQLPEEEAKHCIRVLRKSVGDKINVIDGKGGFYSCEISSITKKICEIIILEKIVQPQHPFKLHIAIAPTKNMDRTEWFVEKCTEIGISEITFLLCERSERKVIKMERIQKIVISAVKQSIKATIPKINKLTKYDDFINKSEDGNKMIAHLIDEDRQYIKKNGSSDNYTILIGPEGDFSPKEVEKAINNDFNPISLGPSRLRTETAGISACQQVNILYF